MIRRRESIPCQKPLIHDFISNNDGFALVVLDACRFDYFADQYHDYLTGDLNKVWSPANRTPVWVPKTWTEQYDITYISANPYAGNFEYDASGYQYCAGERFSRMIEVWDFGWDSEHHCVPPETMTNVALDVANSGEKTRQIIHYIQPHQPYIGEYELNHIVTDLPDVEETISGEKKQEFLEKKSEVTLEEMAKFQISWGEKHEYDISLPDMKKGVKDMISEEKITDEELQTAYRDNLNRVLNEVKRLVSHLDCPVIITSDHGDLLGENGEYMHDPTSKRMHRKLREVPWLIVDESIIGAQENNIQDSALSQSSNQSDQQPEVEERLSYLGYK